MIPHPPSAPKSQTTLPRSVKSVRSAKNQLPTDLLSAIRSDGRARAHNKVNDLVVIILGLFNIYP